VQVVETLPTLFVSFLNIHPKFCGVFFWIQSRIFGPQELASGGGATAFPQKKTLRLTALSSILAPANICHSDMDKHVEQCRTMSNKGMLRYVKCEPK
jgi:hypothetical protein